MDESTEEELEDIRQMNKTVKDARTDIDEAKGRDVDEMLEEYYEKHPSKAPLKHKFKKKLTEYKEERQRTKKIYKEAYRGAKHKAIKQKAKRKAHERYRYKPAKYGRFLDTMQPRTQRRQPSKRNPKPKYVIRGGKAYPIAGSKTKQTRKTPVRRNDNLFDVKPIDMSGLLGGSSKKRKTKSIDPFEKLF